MESFKIKTEPEINVTQEDVDDIVATALEVVSITGAGRLRLSENISENTHLSR